MVQANIYEAGYCPRCKKITVPDGKSGKCPACDGEVKRVSIAIRKIKEPMA